VAEIKGIKAGTNGGDLQINTKVDGGSLTEKLTISDTGAIGIGGANYGNSGQVLTSNGSGSAVSWAAPSARNYANFVCNVAAGFATSTVTDIPFSSSLFASGITLASGGTTFSVTNAGIYIVHVAFRIRGADLWTAAEIQDVLSSTQMAISHASGTPSPSESGCFFMMANLSSGSQYKIVIRRDPAGVGNVDAPTIGHQINCIITQP
jgi:hypothetical protein